MADAILETRDLRKEFDGLVAVDGVSVEFQSDQLHAIIGPNGAGKTTFFNLLTGALEPTSGGIQFKGEDITAVGASEIARRGLIRSYQVAKLFGELSVHENVAVAVRRNHNPYDFWSHADDNGEVVDRADDILEQVGLAGERETPAKNLSHGDQRTLEIAVALGTDPDLLLLDEPTSGMSPEETSEIMHLVESVSDDLPMILIEHKMTVVNEVADQIMVLHNGQKIANGDPEAVRSDEQVRRVYLEGGA